RALSRPDLAATAAFGRALTAAQGEIEAAAGAPAEVDRHEVDAMELVLLRDPVSPQAVPQLGILTRGTVTNYRHHGRGPTTATGPPGPAASPGSARSSIPTTPCWWGQAAEPERRCLGWPPDGQ